MPEMFVNPLPYADMQFLLQFDYPVTYHARRALPNVQIEPPGVQELYGKLGEPKMGQGHPRIFEGPRTPKQEDVEIEDPGMRQDQILDWDRNIIINHTGRLSGSFVKYLANDTFNSVVKMYAHPFTTNEPVSLLHSNNANLKPMQEGINVWFWRDEKEQNELLYTASVNLNPQDKKLHLKPEVVYKLIIKWEFWDTSEPHTRKRMPISGFDEAIAFEIIQKTEDL